MSTARCGTCKECLSTPKRPCETWVTAALAKIKKEIESPAFAQVLNEFAAEPEKRKS